jgi:thiol-disulfide isomerase/thioredoxin
MHKETTDMKAVGIFGRITLILTCLALVTLQVRAFEAKPFEAASFAAAQSAGKPILIDVFAPWCPTCKAQQVVLEELRQNPAYDAVVVFKVDYDNQKDAVRSFGAQRQSTLIAFNGATETGRSVGDTSADGIEALLKSALK